MMNVFVRFGAGLSLGKDVAARSSVTLAQGATVADLLEYLLVQYPAFPLNTAVPVIGGEHVSRSLHLSDGQEVAFILPIAGG